MKVRASYTRKLNHELYGGNSFESSDFHASLELDIPDEEDPSKTYAELYETLKDSVKDAVDKEIMNFQGGIPIQDFKKWVYDYVANRKVEGQIYETMSPFQKDIIQVIKRGKKAKQGDVTD